MAKRTQKLKAQGQQLLEALVGLGKVHTSNVAEGLNMAGEFATGPTKLLAQLLGQASTIPEQEKVNQSLKGTRTAELVSQGKIPSPTAPQPEQSPQPTAQPSQPDTPMSQVKKKVLNDLAKTVSAQATEAIQQNVPAGNVVQQVDEMFPQTLDAQSTEQPSPQAQALTTNQTLPEGEDPNQPGLIQQGITRGAEVLDALLGLGPTSQDRLADAQTDRLQKEVRGELPAQKGEKELLRLQHRNKMAQIIAEAGGEVDDAAAEAEVFKGDLQGLVEAYDKVNLKGALGNIAGAPLGFLGVDREDRETFKDAAESLTFTVASFIAGQEGRALSDRDLKLVERWAKFKLSDRKADFRGKLRNLVNKANTRLRTRGLVELPTNLTGGSTQSTSVTQSVDAEVDAINKRLAELGGE